MASSRPCNDVVRLRDHLEGRLRRDEEADMIAHLDECEDCPATLDRLADDTQILEVARRSGLQAADADETLNRLLADLQGSFDELAGARRAVEQLEEVRELLRLGRLDHYRLLGVAGRGGSGVAIKAVDEKLDRLVCLKLLAGVAMASPTARERFFREARAAAAVHNEHVVQIYAVEDRGSRPYLAMEFVAGRSLQEEIDRRGPLPIDEVVDIGSQIAVGLAAAHARGLVHRDVKPGNILLEAETNRAKLADFGMARTLDDSRLTAEGCIAGTPEYMAPEQVLGDAVDHRADLFSLGSVLSAMCIGRSPFAGGGTLAVLRRIVDEPPQRVERLRPDMPYGLARLIAELHAKAPADRPESAATVLARLAECIAERPARHLLPRRSALLAAAIFAGAGAVAGTWPAISWRDWRRPIDQDGANAAALAPRPAAAAPGFRRVLLVIAPRDYYELYYASVRRQLEQNHVKCQTASTTMAACLPREAGSSLRVQPDLIINYARGGEYDIVYFCGGSDAYGEGGSHSNHARRLIEDALRAGRTVAALGRGPVVLAEAGVLRGRPATCSRWGHPQGEFVARLEAAGAQWQNAPVVEDGQLLTGRDPEDVNQFIRALLKRLGVRSKARLLAEPSG